MKKFVDKLIESFLGECVIYAENYEKALNIANELTEEYINTSTDTSTDTSTTNADRIRSMTDEELAEFLGGVDHTVDDCEFVVKIGDEWLHDSTADILEWLQSEVEGVTENERNSRV